MQNAWKPMYIAILINVLNIVFSFLFVYHFGMKADGVAWGTVVAQYSGLLMAVVLLLASYRKYFKLWSYHKFKQLVEFRHFFNINSHIFLRTLCLIFVFTFFTSKSAATQDNIVLSVNMVLLQFLYIFSYFLDGYAYAGEALVGKFIGRMDKTNMLKSIKYLFYWGAGLSVLFSIIYLFGNQSIVKMLTPEEEIILVSRQYAVWIILLPVLSFASYIWDGIYIGATASKYMLVTMAIAAFIFFIPSYYILTPEIGNHGLWIAMLLFMLARGIFQTVWWKRAILGHGC